MAKRKTETYRLVERLASELGLRRATSVLEFIGCWCIASESLGRPPVNIEEYAEWWRISRAQAFREQQMFRAALPELQTPTPIWEQLRRDHSELFRGKTPAPVVAMRLGGIL